MYARNKAYTTLGFFKIYYALLLIVYTQLNLLKKSHVSP